MAGAERTTLPLGTYTFQAQYSHNDAGIMAFTAMAMLPALAVLSSPSATSSRARRVP